MVEFKRVTPHWLDALPLQQQSVVLLALRGPDGVRKHHPCKHIVRAYRGTILCAAKYGRWLKKDECADTFMDMGKITSGPDWIDAVKLYFDVVDELPHHYHLHLLHGAQVIGYKHYDPEIASPWLFFYEYGCKDAHMTPETEAEMDCRLSDWERVCWD